VTSYPNCDCRGCQWDRYTAPFRDEVKRLEALVRAKDETIGELLELAEYQPEPVVVYRRLGA
jgi:hypothetical protein